jgi:hypothetical protein
MAGWGINRRMFEDEHDASDRIYLCRMARELVRVSHYFGLTPTWLSASFQIPATLPVLRTPLPDL